MLRQVNSDGVDNTKNLNITDSSLYNIQGKKLIPGSTVKLKALTNDGFVSKIITVTMVPKNQATAWNHTVAPYVDMGMLWPGNNLHDITLIYAGVTSLTTAFIQQNTTSKDVYNPAWNGSAPLDGPLFPSQKELLDVINKNINSYEATGGQISASSGGAVGTPVWSHLYDLKPTGQQIGATLNEVVNRYSLYRLDFDIEGREVTDVNGLQALGEGINIVKVTHPNLEISLTIAVDPALSNGIDPAFRNAYTKLGATLNDMPIINIMSMDYGLDVPGDQMAKVTITAAKKNC